MTKTFYKITDAKGNNIHQNFGVVHYEVGKVVEISDFDTSNVTSGKGLYVCGSVDGSFYFSGILDATRTKLFEVSVEDEDILASDNEKTRVKKLKVVRELDNSETYGPNHLELFELINKLPTFPYLKPAKDLDLGIVEKLVHKHLEELCGYAEPDAFSGVTVKFVKTQKAYLDIGEAAWNAAKTIAWSAPCGAQSDIARAAARGFVSRSALFATGKAAVGVPSDVAVANIDYATGASVWHTVKKVAENASVDIAHGTGPRPWKPLMDIFALGCVPVLGLVNKEFIVWVPQEQSIG